jgi:hypothetical protein
MHVWPTLDLADTASLFDLGVAPPLHFEDSHMVIRTGRYAGSGQIGNAAMPR